VNGNEQRAVRFDVVKSVVASGLVVSRKEEATLGSAGGPWVCKATALDLDSSGGFCRWRMSA
jgi:hypothetical protein